MTNEIRNTDDMIDSRDVIARIEELEDERSDLAEAIEDAEDAEDAAAKAEATKELEAWDADNGPELSGLKALADEAEGAEDWEYGATLIRDSYFTAYARELLEDIGEIPRDLPHYIEIDWERTADNIRTDYFPVSFDGVTYWVR